MILFTKQFLSIIILQAQLCKIFQEKTMPEITVPKYVKNVIKDLTAHGYPACIVGGCVRDMFLGVTPNDWDIATAALPEQVIELFPDSIPTGIKHGTVTVRSGGQFVEVTTFRADEGYADHRHPDTVSFVGDLTTDLSRRDFTVNAMAISPSGTVIDPYRGLDDIRAGIIRCVGAPEKRFREDALRMLRAFRFSSRLGFTIDPETLSAIKDNASLAAGLSAERVRDEVEKILMTDKPETVFTVMELGLLDTFLVRRPESDVGFACISAIKKNTQPRWAAFAKLLLEDGCIENVWDFLKSLRLDGHTVRCGSAAAEILASPPPETNVEWKRLLRRYGVDAAECAALCCDALYSTGHADALKKVLKSGECFSLKYLAVNGNDLAALGLYGRPLGEMLEFLLDYVIDYPENNRRELLLSLASQSED